MIKKTTIKTTKDFHSERMTQGQNVGVINLGCARNLVDSQTILSNMKRQGHRIVDVEQSDIVVVNTCAFIEEAKKESIDTIIDLLELKKKGRLKKVIVAGCLAQRYSRELMAEFKDIDAIIGTQQLKRDDSGSDVSLTPGHYAYVKISESCYNRCGFCIIPKIKGKFISRTIESIVDEIKRLDDKGVREVNLIGQDITAYGMDLYHELSLAKLLKSIIPVANHIQWIRLLYAFPAHVTDELIEVIASEKRICKYIDIPLQHISDHILSSMNRNMTTEQTVALMAKFRKAMPQGSLRTTFIVGLPGESKEDFDELLRFMKDIRFEKVGTFIYSREEGTPAYDMPDQVPEKTKKERLNVLMSVQQDISREKQKELVGRTLRVLIDEPQQGDKNIFLGRCEFDAPDVDGIVYVHSSKDLRIGDFIDVHITDAYEYDLAGEVG